MGSIATYWGGKESSTFGGQPLQRTAGNTISPVILIGKCKANGWLAAEIIVRKGKILQIWQGTNSNRNVTRQLIVCNIELLQAHHVSNRTGYRPHQFINAYVKNRYILQLPNLYRQTRGKTVIQQNDLIQSSRHLTQASGKAAVKFIIRQYKDRYRRVSDISRN